MALDITTVAVAALGSLTGIAALISARNTHKEIRGKVDAEAYKVAQSLYDEALKLARDENKNTLSQLAQTRIELRETRALLEEAHNRLANESTDRRYLEIQIHELRLEVGRLKQRLRQAGVSLDDSEDDNF